jgi:hypothetical protein
MSDDDARRSIEPRRKKDGLATAHDRAADNHSRDVLDDFGPQSDASYRSPSFQPILGERVLRRFELLFNPHRVRARTGLVLVNRRGKYHTFFPEGQPTMGELLWKGARTLYEVDMGLHWTSLEFDLPSLEEAFPFHAVVDIEWRVIKPAQVVRDGVNDVREALSPVLHHQLSAITRGFSVEETPAAEKKVFESLSNHPIGAEYGLRSRVYVQMRMDEPTVTYAAAIRKVQREIKLEHETQELRLLREESTTALITRRVERYRAIILAGDYNQFALQLAQNPDEVAAVVQMLRDERHDNRRSVIDFVTHLLDSGAIDRYEINDQVQAALNWLKEATDTVLRGPEQPTTISGQRESDALPATCLPESNLPDPPQVEPMRSPEGPPTHGAGKP